MMPDQNVYVSFRENEKSNTRRRPVAPARRNAVSGLTGRRTKSTTTTAMRAVMMTTICFTSAHATACTPPIIV